MNRRMPFRIRRYAGETLRIVQTCCTDSEGLAQLELFKLRLLDSAVVQVQVNSMVSNDHSFDGFACAHGDDYCGEGLLPLFGRRF